MVKWLGRSAVVLFLPFLIVACGNKYVDVAPEARSSKWERPLEQMMMHRQVNDRIYVEDKWFTYELLLEPAVANQFTMQAKNFGGQCKYQGATYTVVDKETDTVVRLMRLDSQPCNNCHQR